MGGSNQGLGGNGDEGERGWEHWWEPEILTILEDNENVRQLYLKSFLGDLRIFLCF